MKKQLLRTPMVFVLSFLLVLGMLNLKVNAVTKDTVSFNGWAVFNEGNGNTIFKPYNELGYENAIHARKPKNEFATDVGVLEQLLSGLEIGETYTLTFDLKTDNSSAGMVQAMVWNATDGTNIEEPCVYGENFNTDNQWKTYSMNFVPKLETPELKILISTVNWLDDYKVQDYNAYIANVHITKATDIMRHEVGPTLAGWTKCEESGIGVSLCTTDSSDEDGASVYIPAGSSLQYRFAPYLPDGEYIFSYKVKALDGDGVKPQIFVPGSQNPWDNATAHNIVQGEWVTVTSEYNTESTIERIVVYAQSYNCLFDEFSMTNKTTGQEYLYNGNFYSKGSSDTWTFAGSDNYYADVVEGVGEDAGIGYLWLSKAGTFDMGDPFQLHSVAFDKSLTVGEKYTLTFDAIGTAATNEVRIAFELAGGNSFGANVTGDGWSSYSHTFIIDEGQTDIMFLYSLGVNQDYCVWIKNISLKDESNSEYLGNITLMSNKPSDHIATSNFVHENHTYEWETVEEATCGQDGFKKEVCIICGAEGETEVIPATGNHTYEWGTVEDSTCGQDGFKKEVCIICGAEGETEVIPATGNHTYEWETVGEATCGLDGIRKQVCIICGAEGETEVIPATGNHTYEWETVEEATCGLDGIRKQVCIICGAEGETEVIPATGNHTYEWIIKREPTCTKTGLKKQICSACYAEGDIQEIEPTEHTEGEWEIIREATETKEGLKIKKCTVCGETIISEGIPVREVPDGGADKTPHTGVKFPTAIFGCLIFFAFILIFGIIRWCKYDIKTVK